MTFILNDERYAQRSNQYYIPRIGESVQLSDGKKYRIIDICRLLDNNQFDYINIYIEPI